MTLNLLDGGFSEEEILGLVQISLGKHGRIAGRSDGMCGSVYFFDQGEDVHPRWVAAKIPISPKGDRTERNKRFLREIEIQHRTFYHRFVSYPFDYQMVFDTPVALYRASDGDLSRWIPRADFSIASRLAVLAYLCSALIHCRARGVECHQDLKPQNILMRAAPSSVADLADDVFEFPLLADFGLANLGIDTGNAEGARPYMAPEQWIDKVSRSESDTFAFGVIIFEVMTAGRHPCGELTRDWWPVPVEGRSKKWLRPETWVKRANAGNPVVSAPFLVDGVEAIARACMATDPDVRPSLTTVQSELINVLRGHDPDAAVQVSFQIAHADSRPHGSSEWPYRDDQLVFLQKSIVGLE